MSAVRIHHDAMIARGWTWNEEIRCYTCMGAEDRQGCPILNMRVSHWWPDRVEPNEWVASYGVPGIGYGTYKRHATPMGAADEAEAWLRGVLAPMALPWLNIGAKP